MARTAIVLILLLAGACPHAPHPSVPACAPGGKEPCGDCAARDELSPAGRLRLAFEAQRALLLAETQEGLFTGDRRSEGLVRFYSSELDEDAVSDRTTGVPRSPGRDAEVEIAKARPGQPVYHFAMHTRRFSGRDGALVDVTITSVTWVGGPHPVAEEGVDMTYCVRRGSDGTLRIQTTATGMVYG